MSGKNKVAALCQTLFIQAHIECHTKHIEINCFKTLVDIMWHFDIENIMPLFLLAVCPICF